MIAELELGWITWESFYLLIIGSIWHLMSASSIEISSNCVRYLGLNQCSRDTRLLLIFSSNDGKTWSKSQTKQDSKENLDNKPNGARCEAASWKLFDEMRITLEICPQTLEQPDRISTNLECFVEGLPKDKNSAS